MKTNQRSLLQRAAYRGLLAGLAVLAGGCAGVKFYSDGEVKHETGIRFYTAKPYLLVRRTGAAEKPVEIEIVQLPDLGKPSYAKFKPGWGSHDISLKFENGILTEYSQTADTTGADTIRALGEAFKSASDAYRTLYPVPSPAEATSDESFAAALASASREIQATQTRVPQRQLQNFVQQFMLPGGNPLPELANDLQQMAASVTSGVKRPADYAAQLQGISSQVRSLLVTAPGVGVPREVGDGLKAALHQISRALRLASVPDPASDPAEFELYLRDSHPGGRHAFDPGGNAARTAVTS